jgi:hypothetical protein
MTSPIALLGGLLLLVAAASPVEARTPPELPADLSPKLKILQPGVKLTLLAKNPDLVTPIGIDVDASGQIWVVASHTHFRPDPYPGPKFDEILVFDQDGKNRRVFYNKTEATMDLELGPDGWVYLAERDRILRIKDSDGDGRADLEENLAVLATEETYPHNGLAGLAWHPEGDLVFSLGENFWKKWTLTGTDETSVTGTGEGGVFRCSAEGGKLRRVARGFWNPFGVCVRADGEIFVAENDPGSRPPCRLLHVVQGGDYGYQRRYGKAPVHPFVAWNGELRGTLPMISATGEAPCGVVPLGGGLLVPSWSDNRIDFFPLTATGASFTAKRIQLVSGSDQFRPTCIAVGPKGAYYLTDWVYTSYEIHQQGRLWKLEIDPVLANWIAPAAVGPASEVRKRANEVRVKDQSSLEQVLRFAKRGDPFLRQAYLEELIRRAPEWREEVARKWSASDRISVVLARRRAKPKDVSWAHFALKDEDPEVRFEALRWIADEDLVGLAPEVEKLLQSSALSFRLFEACLATSNTLAGNPRAGVTDQKMLLARVRDESSSTALRAYALRLLNPQHKGVNVAQLQKLIALGDEELTFEAVRTLVARSADQEAMGALAKLAKNGELPVRTRAEAIIGLTVAPHPSGEVVFQTLLELIQSSERAIREEAMRSFRGVAMPDASRKMLQAVVTKYPESADLLEFSDPQKRVSLPPLQDTAAWQKRIDSAKGEPDLEVGRRLFFRQNMAACVSCHRHDGRGAVVGPELTKIAARGDGRWLLEAILQPGKEVPPQFHPWSLKLKDDSTFTGYLLRKGGRSGKEYYREVTGRERAILKSEIVSRKQMELSLMPPGLTTNLTARELRDLMVFLMSPAVPSSSP